MDWVCKEAIWLASLLMTNDKYFAAEITDLVWQKNQIENLRKVWLFSEKELNQRLHTINEKINLFIEAKLLSGQWKHYSLWAEARSKLIKHLEDAWWSIERNYSVLASIVENNIVNKQEITTLLADWTDDAENMIAKFNDAFAKYVIAKDKMRGQWIKKELSDTLADVEKAHMNTAGKEWWWQWLKDIDEANSVSWIEQPSLFRRSSMVDEWYETLTEKEVREIVYKYFDSDEISVTFSDNLRTPAGQDAMWRYFDKMITFAKNPAKYTPEHEVVHAYIDLFLTAEEKRNLLSWAMLDYWEDAILDYMKLFGIENFDEAVEEMIADWFIKYAKRKQWTWKLRWIFDELWYRIKKIFGNEDRIRSLYDDITNKVRRNPWVTRWSQPSWPRFKVVKKSVKESITAQSIRWNPLLQEEYASRVESIRMLQQIINEDLDYIKNFWWFFSWETGLLWTAKISEMWDAMESIARRYSSEWESIENMTLWELRNRVIDIKAKYKDAHKQKNVIAQMEKDREEWNLIIEMFQTKDITTDAWVKLKDNWRITKEWVTTIIRDWLDREQPSKWKSIKKPNVSDPIIKSELSDEAESILKENIKKDVEQVLKWEAPSNVASADEIWKQFWERSDDVVEREKMLNNFLIWKIYLWESEDVLKSALKMLDGKNLEWYWTLTLKQIEKITDLWQLEQVVFTHIWDLIYDKALRDALKTKQYELWTTSSPTAAIWDAEVLSKARSMQKTSEFLEAWWYYTDVTLYDKVWNALKWIFEIDKNVNNRDLYDEFVTAVTNYSSRRKSNTVNVWWIEMDATDLVKWIYAISWDDLVRDISALKADPESQLKVAARKLFNIWTEAEAKAAEKRIKDLFNNYSPTDLKDADTTKMAYATTSAVKIEWEMTDWNVVFYNYRDWLYAKETQTTYWEFFDELAKQNSVVIDSTHNMKEIFNITDIPSDTKYIIVNDINRWDDKELKDFIYWLPEDQRPQVIYPKWWQMGNYYVEWWKLKFKTTSSQLYKEITRDASARTLWAFARSMEDVTESQVKELEEKAIEYFRTIMWLDKKWAPSNKAEYKAWVINNLRIMTWLPISAEMDVYNPQSTWKMANDIIRYQLWATWRYTKVIKNVDDEITMINDLFDSNIDEFFDMVKNVVWWNDEIMAKNADAIKDSFISYSVADTIESKIQAKGVLMALCNWWEYDQITVELFNWALRNDDFVSVLWPIIYWAREYTDTEIQALNRLWDDILSMYVFELWSNIIRSWWYSMPLVSPAETIRKLLKWESIMWDDFVQAFIKKNWLQENSSLIEQILTDALPQELDISIPTSILLNPSTALPNIVVEEVPNVIIPTNYNQLMAIIKKQSSKWWWVTWEEESIIKWILDNYYNAVSDAIDAWTMTPTLAQQLKIQAWWALDRAEQDLIISKYNEFLTLEQRNWLMWGKYKLRIATTKEELNAVKEWNDDIITWYRSKLWDMWKEWIKTYSSPDKARKDLIEKWKVMTQINGNVVTMNVHDLLIQQIETLPDWLKWIFKNFESLTVNDIRWIPYAQAYAIIKAIDLAKNASARWNLYARLMYKQNPNLANISFFNRYTLNSDWIPYALQRNAAKLVDASISDWVDLSIKQNIMLEISSVMKKKWVITDEELDDIIKNELSLYNKESVIANHYKNMFKAYTYLTNIPKDVKVSINKMLDVQLKEIRNELSWMDNDFVEWILNSRITLADWTEMTLRDVISWDIDMYKKNLFIEKRADWVYDEVTQREFTSKELKRTDNEVRAFSDSMYSMLNSVDNVSDVERKMNTVILWDARQILNKYTTTKKLIDADYLIWWQNDLLRNLIKSNAFSDWWKLWWESDFISKLWWKFTNKTFFNKNNWNTIRDYYYAYYRQSSDVLDKMKVTNDLQATALEMAKYFKRIENTLGSVDWTVWASVNTSLNKAFWNIWTIVLNVNTSEQVNNLMQAIWNNQVLAFFKFAKEWEWAFFDLFSNIKTNRLKWAWVEYVRDVELQDVKRFNEVFNTNFNRWEYVIIMQALWWYKIWWPVQQWINWLMRWVNYSWTLARTIMSYPFQLFTIAPQSIAYNLKANWFKKDLWIESLYEYTRIREYYDILTSEYVELNPKSWLENRSWIRNVLAKYTWDEVDALLKSKDINMDDSIVELFWKSYDYVTSKFRWQQFVQLFDATRDNANNIIDALMAQRFKSLAFAKALKYNDVVPFENARAFEIFMKDVDIPQELKDRVLDSVKIYSWRIFKDMLWTGFSWLDKMYGANAAQNILIWLMNTINFRWAWWLNMFRQTAWKIWSALKTVRFIWDARLRSQAVDYIARTPEFSDLSTALFNDLYWMWRLARFSDNGKRPNDESEADIMDYCEWVLSNIELVSQQWQGMVSFWPMRPLIAQAEAIIDHQRDPNKYWDEYWIWALINTLVSNIWRNRKPANFVIKALRVGQADWDMSSAWAYIANHWHELSAWTLRYMIEEWYNDYGSNIPLVYETWWIPSIIAGNQWAGSDTAFLYKMRQAETWEYLKNIRAWKDGYEVWWLISQLTNLSQLLSMWKESVKLALVEMWRDDLKSSKTAYWLDDMDEAYAWMPEWEERRTTWFIKPKHEVWYETYYDSIINVFTEWKNPWWAKFFEWLYNFKEFWHINKQAEANYFDVALEEFYTRILEKDPNAFNEILDNPKIHAMMASSDTAWAIQLELSWANKWLKEFEWDAEYNKYATIIYKWVMSNVLYNELQAFADRKTDEYKSMWYLPKKKDKFSASEIKNVWWLYKEFKQEFVDKHWDDLMVADVEWMQWAMFKFLVSKNKEAADKFFVEKEYDWEKKYYLKSALKSQVQQLIDFERFMDEWNWEAAIVQWTQLTKTFSYDHIVSANTAMHIMNRISESDALTDKMKLEAMTEFVANNLDAFTYDWDFATENPELWEEVKWHYNELNYQASIELINAMNDYALSLSSDKEKSWKWGWRLSLKLKSIMSALRKNQQDTWWARWKWYQITWIKAPIIDPTKVFVEDSKVPQINFNVKFSSRAYTPKTNLWWTKTTAKPVKVKKTKVKEKDIEVL